VDPYVRSGVQTEGKDQKRSIYVCPDVDQSVPDPAWVAANGAPGSRAILSYGTNVHLMPRGRDLVWPVVPPVVPLAAVGSPASLVMLGPSLGTIPDINGRDDRYEGASKHEQGTMLARRRHSGGAIYTFADGHAKWFKAPEDYRAQSRTGVCWLSPRQGPQYAACSGWFFPLGD
jgi:prepilin-type processing-associated H-X9-DG protein